MSYQKPVTNLNEAFEELLLTDDWETFYTHLINFFAVPFTRKYEFWLISVLGKDTQEKLIYDVANTACEIIAEANLLDRYDRKEIDNPYGYLKFALFNRLNSKKWSEMKNRIEKILQSNPSDFSKYLGNTRTGSKETKYFLTGRQPESEVGTGALTEGRVPVSFQNAHYIKESELKDFIIEAMEQELRPLSARELTEYLEKKGWLNEDALMSANRLEEPFEDGGVMEIPAENQEKDGVGEIYDRLDEAALRKIIRKFIEHLDERHQRSLYFICKAAQGNSEERSEDLFKRAAKMMGGKVTPQTIRNHIKQIDERFKKEMNPYIGENFEDLQRARMLLCEEAIQILSRKFEKGADE